MAETEGQRRLAFRQMTGALGGRAENWRAQLIQALALVEARIDFSDEADVPQDLVTPALRIARALEAEIGSVLADRGRGERLREGLIVAIAGPPNVGKSTLLNRIAKREAAIVSPYAGTTRDVIEVHLDLAGTPGDTSRYGGHSRNRRSCRTRGCTAGTRTRQRGGLGPLDGGCE